MVLANQIFRQRAYLGQGWNLTNFNPTDESSGWVVMVNSYKLLSLSYVTCYIISADNTHTQHSTHCRNSIRTGLQINSQPAWCDTGARLWQTETERKMATTTKDRDMKCKTVKVPAFQTRGHISYSYIPPPRDGAVTAVRYVCICWSLSTSLSSYPAIEGKHSTVMYWIACIAER